MDFDFIGGSNDVELSKKELKVDVGCKVRCGVSRYVGYRYGFKVCCFLRLFGKVFFEIMVF